VLAARRLNPYQTTENRSGTLRSIYLCLIVICFLAASAHLSLGQDKDDPLTEVEVDKLREVADQPMERIKLYMEYIGKRTDAIAEMGGDSRIQNKPPKIRKLLQEYTRLVDELQDNLDNYDETHADIRKQLKLLVPESKKWLDIVSKPPADPIYDFPRKTAADAAQGLVDQVSKLQTDQEKFFAEQKKRDKEQEKNGTAPTPQ
jgi:hypothetical protein